MKDTLEFLSSFALEIISPADPDQLLKNALEKLLSGMDFRTGIIYILDDSGEQLILKVQCGIPNKIYKELKKRPANSDQTASEALSSGVPIVQRDFSRIDRIYKTLIKPKTLLLYLHPCF